MKRQPDESSESRQPTAELDFDAPVAVNGATGFIGSAVVRELVKNGRRVRALVEPGARLDNLADLDVQRVEVDVCDFDGMLRALDGCASFFHLAAIYRLWLPDPSLIYRVNLEGTTTCLLAAQKVGIQRVVYTSSIAAVGLRADGAPSDESVPFNLHDIANSYILTKHLSERIAMRFAEAGMPIVVVNPAFPFGERDSAPTPTGEIILRVLQREVPVTTPGGFCAIDVLDVAKAHVAAETKGRLGERYILGNHNVTFVDFVKLVCKTANVKEPRLHVPSAVGAAAAAGFEMWAKLVTHDKPLVTLKSAQYMMRTAHFDASKARAELNMPCTPLAESVDRAVRYFRSSGMA